MNMKLLRLTVGVLVIFVAFSMVTFMQLFAESNEIPPPFLQLNAPPGNTISNLTSSKGYPSISISSLTVSGIIVDSETQEPILRARLSFYRASTGDLLLTNVFTGSDGSFEALLSTGVNIERTPSTASDYWLGNVYPNPVSSTQRINLQYTTPGDQIEAPILEMYDVLGRRVYPSTVLASGVYFYRLRFSSGNLTSTRSFVLTRSGALSINLQQKLEDPADNYKSLPGIQSFEEEGIMIQVEKKAYENFEEIRASGTLNESLRIDLVPAVRPSASFVFGEKREAGQPVTLDASASTGPDGQDLTYSWDFGDGRRGGQPRIARIYPDGGTYTVTLTVATEEGATHSISQDITITETQPTGRTVALVGLVRDASGKPLPEAEVRVSGTDISALTGTDGTIELESVPGEEHVMIEVRRDGYALQRIPLKLSLEGEARYYFETALLARHESVLIEDIEFGVDVAGPAGARVVLGPESLVDRDGNIVTGDVTMTITPVDMSDPNAHDAFPGGFLALEPDGSEVLIVSYGAAEYIFEQNGEPLQLAPGRTAVIEIPVFVTQHPDCDEISEGDVIPMWSLHPETGRWIEEGTGVIVPSETSPTGFVQRGEVTHFSWWNSDVAPNAPRPWAECLLRGQDAISRRICQVMAKGREKLPGMPKVANVNSCAVDPCGADISDRPFGGPRNITIPEEGTALLLPPDYPLILEARAGGGIYRGSIEVCRTAGNNDPIIIELRPIDFEGGLLVKNEWSEGGLLLSDQSLSYTFEAEIGERLFFDIRRLAQTEPDFSAAATVISPGGKTVTTTSFGNIEGVVYFQTSEAGEHTVRVDRLASEGSFELRITDAPAPVPAQPFQPLTGRPNAGERHVIAFSAQDSVGLAVSISRGVGSMIVRFVAESGGPLIERATVRCPTFGFCTNYSSIRILLPDDANYLLIMESSESNTQLPSYSAAYNPIIIENIDIDQLVEGSLEFQHQIWYRFEASEGMIIRGGFSGPLKSLNGPSWQLFGPNFTLLSSSASWMQNKALGVRIPADGPYHFRLDATLNSGSYDGSLDYQMAVSTVSEEIPVLINGRTEIEMDELPLPGSLKIYRFSAENGAGLVGMITPTGEQPLPQPIFELYRVGEGTFYAPQDQFYDSNMMGRFMNGPQMALRLNSQPDDDYLLVVRNTNDSYGSYDLIFDMLNPAASFTVSADMSCPGADTPALFAAALAVQDSGTITVCEGTYFGPTSLYTTSEGLVLQGTDRDNVVIGTEMVGNNTFWVDRANVTIENLTFVISDRRIGFNSQSAIALPSFSYGAPGLTVRNIRIYSSTTGQPYGKGISGRSDGGRIQNVDIRNVDTGIEFSGGRDFLIENSFIEASTGIILNDVPNSEIRDNTIESRTGSRRGIVNQSSGSIIEDNIIRILPGGGGSPTGIQLSETGTSDRSSVVRRNQILFEPGGGSAGERGIYALIGIAQPVIIEQNVIDMRATRGGAGVDIIPTLSNASSEITIRNNIIRHFVTGGIHLRNVHMYTEPVHVYNNTLLASPWNSTSVFTGILLQGESGTSGALLVTAVNNIIEGRSGRTNPDHGITLPPDATLDADFNLFYEVTAYFGGITSTGLNDLVDTNPLFVPDEILLLLQAASPAIGAGAGTADYPERPAVDYSGKARPAAASTIGAHEYIDP